MNRIAAFRAPPMVACVMGAAVWAFVANHAVGYQLTGRDWFPPYPGAPVTLTYSFSNFFDGGLLDAAGGPVPEAQLREGVEEALMVWASVAPLHFVEVEDAWAGEPISDAIYPDGQFGTIRVGHHAIDGFGSTKAHAYFPPWTPSPTCNLCGDVHFDTLDRWELLGTLEYPDVLGAAIHELGHSLGLGHSDIGHQLDADPPIFDGANMFPTFRRHTGPGSGSLHPDDIAGIQEIYGAGIGSVTPLAAVPEPSALAQLGILLTFFGRRRRVLGHCVPSAPGV